MGIRILLSEHTVGLLPPDLFLVRPIGKLKLVGVARAEMAYDRSLISMKPRTCRSGAPSYPSRWSRVFDGRTSMDAWLRRNKWRRKSDQANWEKFTDTFAANIFSIRPKRDLRGRLFFPPNRRELISRLKRQYSTQCRLSNSNDRRIWLGDGPPTKVRIPNSRTFVRSPVPFRFQSFRTARRQHQTSHGHSARSRP